MDRFDSMRAFVRVVEAGSFTKAADTLRMNRTTVTQLVQQLEARLRNFTQNIPTSSSTWAPATARLT